eukprot:362546-Chlamydomonas_euryale.AAC.2
MYIRTYAFPMPTPTCSRRPCCVFVVVNVGVWVRFFGTSSSGLATLHRFIGQRSEQRRRNVPWTGKPGGR